MDNSVTSFYDRLADDYHLLFADWRQAIERQGAALDTLIQKLLGRKALSLLDCSCGIGTQAIGLALRGYRVHGTDVSTKAVERARREAEALGTQATFDVADMRALPQQVVGRFDVVISCDNSLPHLLSDEDLEQATHGVASKLVPGGLFLASIRDYDAFGREQPAAMPPRVFDTPEGRRVVFQVWDWAGDDGTYTINHFIVQEDGGRWTTSHAATRYRALLRADLDTVLAAADFSRIQWYMPEETGYYQPVVTARKR